MTVRMELEDIMFKFEQTTATLGLIQTAIAEGSSIIDDEEAAAATYMLYKNQNDLVQKFKDTLKKVQKN